MHTILVNISTILVFFTPIPPLEPPKTLLFSYVYFAYCGDTFYPQVEWQSGWSCISGRACPKQRKVKKRLFRKIYECFYRICVSIYNMGSQKERVERLQLLAKMKKQHEKDETSEVLSRHLLEDYMIQMWFLGHQTRSDYLEVLFRSQKRDD